MKPWEGVDAGSRKRSRAANGLLKGGEVEEATGEPGTAKCKLEDKDGGSDSAPHGGGSVLSQPWRKKYPNLRQDICTNTKEKELFETLKATVARFGLETQVRVAGGWVRDKMLGRESDDIDIALDNMTGEAFAKLVNEYLSEKGQPTHRIGVVMANPLQSKHLETAMLNVLGLNIDFVNLRSEEYQGSSRIPKTSFGGAKEDAARRDFTINAMFYNVNSDQLEDLTGLGIADLRDGIIRTPLPPGQTFKDDPLRMLRAIRFASRYGFVLHESVSNALRDSDNVFGLQTKVSRERIGTELFKAFNGANPAYALDLLLDNGLMPVVCAWPEPPPIANQQQLPSKEKQKNKKRSKQHEDSKGETLTKKLSSYMGQERMQEEKRRIASAVQRGKCAFAQLEWTERTQIAKAMLEVAMTGDAFSVSLARTARPKDVTSDMVICAGLFHGLGDLDALNTRHKLEPLVTCLVRDSIKLRHVTADAARSVVTAAPILDRVATELSALGEAQSGLECLRDQIGELMFKHRELFHVALCLASIVGRAPKGSLEKLFTKISGPEWGLAQIWKEVPPCNGKELIKVSGLGRGGPIIGALSAMQKRWIVANRTQPFYQDAAARKERCMQYLRDNKEKAIATVEEREKEIEARKAEEAKKREKMREIALKAREQDELAQKVTGEQEQQN